MALSSPPRRGRRRISLSVRLTLLVFFAALLPVTAVVAINDYFTRTTLTTQGQEALSTDATANATLVDDYLHERFLDGAALASLETTPGFLLCTEAQAGALPATTAQAIAGQCADPNFGLAFSAGSVCRGLAVGVVRDPNYAAWSIFTPTGVPLLNATQATATTLQQSPTLLTSAPCQSVKGVSIWQDELQRVQEVVVKQASATLSPVLYDPTSNHAYTYLYTPICAKGTCQPNQSGQAVVGFMRATLQLDAAQAGAQSIWGIVNNEAGANGAGSSAFITDDAGIIIADPNASQRFTAITPLSADAQAQIAKDERFGNAAPIQVNSLPAVATAITSNNEKDEFQAKAVPGGTEVYQFVRVKLHNAPWSYFVLSPLSTVTAVANDQLRTSLESAGVIALLAILIGLLFGRALANPVRASVSELERAVAALKALSDRQANSASEQTWVVEACKTGMETVRFLSDAMNQAARRVIDASNWFDQYWDRLTEDQARRTVQHLRELAHYINQAAAKQQTNNESLDKAIGVTLQVSDQLAAGASEAAASADQLEVVVADLQRVVGGHPQTSGIMVDDQGNSVPELPAPQVPGGAVMGDGYGQAQGGYGYEGYGGYNGYGGVYGAGPGTAPGASQWGGDYAPANPQTGGYSIGGRGMSGYGQMPSSPWPGQQPPPNDRSRW